MRRISKVERLVTSAERSVFRGLSPSEQCKAFFDCWTRKEAYLKGLGVDLQWSPTVSLFRSRPKTLQLCWKGQTGAGAPHAHAGRWVLRVAGSERPRLDRKPPGVELGITRTQSETRIQKIKSTKGSPFQMSAFCRNQGAPSAVSVAGEG